MIIINKILIIIIFLNIFKYDQFFVSAESSMMLPPGFCPSPLIYRNSSDRVADTENGYNFIGDTQCVLPCPSPLFSSNWESYFLMSLIVGSISMFASLFLIITYSPLVNKKHTRHTVGILCMSIGIFFITVSDGRQLWDIEIGYEKYCPEPGRYARQSDTKCLTTGLFFQYGCVTAILYWSILAVDLWITIAKKIITTQRQIIYFSIGLNSLALALTFGPVFGKQYGFGQAAIGCWMMDLKYQYGFFWIPVGICLCIGSVFIGMIFYEIYKISDSLKRKYLKKHIKPLCLIVLMCLEFFYMFIYYSYVTANQPKYNKHVADYIMCLMINAANVPGSFKCELNTVSPSSQFFFLLAVRLMGLQGLIFYGLTRSTKRIWQRSYWLNNPVYKFVKHCFIRYIYNYLSSEPINTNSANSGSYDITGSGYFNKSDFNLSKLIGGSTSSFNSSTNSLSNLSTDSLANQYNTNSNNNNNTQVNDNGATETIELSEVIDSNSKIKPNENQQP